MSLTDPDRFEPGYYALSWRSGTTYRERLELYLDADQTIPYAVGAASTWRSQVRLEEDEEAALLATIVITVPSPTGNAIDLYVSAEDVTKAVLAGRARGRGFWSLKQIAGDDAESWLVGEVALNGDPTKIGGA